MVQSGRMRLIATAILGLVAGPLSLAQAPRPMTLVDLLEVPGVSDPQLSSDGRQSLYVVARADWRANQGIAHIWRINADGSGAVQLTHGENGESSPRWSPDGRTIAFLARRGDSDRAQIYLMRDGGGEAWPLSQHASAVSNISWAPDGNVIYFLAADAKTPVEGEREANREDVFAFEEDFKHRHLWNISVKDGSEQKVTAGEYSVDNYRISRDGRKAVTHRALTHLPGDWDTGEVWVMNADGTGAVRLTRNEIGETNGELSPDNARVLFLARGNREFEPYYNDNLFIISAAGGVIELMFPDFPYQVEHASWSNDGQSVFLVVNMGVHSELFQLALPSKSLRQLTEGLHAVRGWKFVAAADRHIFQLDEPSRPAEIWTVSSGAGATAVRVTKVYEEIARTFKLPRQERIDWKSVDGVTVEGLLYFPLDYEPGKRYPLCVQTHGGPEASDKFGFGSWTNYVQVLTAKGYVVLKPNYRGSTGYGNAFFRGMVGGYFRNSHVDVMTGVDHVIKMGIADPERMVKMGFSAGGHMTNKIITFTDRFKAASSGAGAANWISMYAQAAERGAHRTPWFGGTPWQKNAPIDVYWEHSPLKYVANVKTPTIFWVGQNDPEVPPPQSVEMYRALKGNGVPTRLYVAPRELHSWRELRHRLFKMNVELEWFEKYARGKPYVWERAPVEPRRPAVEPPAIRPMSR